MDQTLPSNSDSGHWDFDYDEQNRLTTAIKGGVTYRDGLVLLRAYAMEFGLTPAARSQIRALPAPRVPPDPQAAQEPGAPAPDPAASLLKGHPDR